MKKPSKFSGRHSTTAALGAVVVGASLSGCATSETIDAPPTPAAYADGSYSARGWYGSLPSHHDVTLTVSDGFVSAVEITTPAEDPTSLGYQERFAEALPGAVVGKSLDEISVDALAGSSGCSEGFMNALDDIRRQAGRV